MKHANVTEAADHLTAKSAHGPSGVLVRLRAAFQGFSPAHGTGLPLKSVEERVRLRFEKHENALCLAV